MPEASIYIGRIRTARVVRGRVVVKGIIAVTPPLPGVGNPLTWGVGNELQWGTDNSLTWG